MAMRINLDDTFVQLSEHDKLTFRNAMTSFFAVGEPGSGKSSGSGATLLRAYMKHGFGMCCLTVKPEETFEIMEIARSQGREKDVIKISPESGFSHDPFLAEDVREVGAETRTLVKLYANLIEIASGKQKDTDSYWNNAQQTLLTAAIIVLKCAGEPVSIENIYRFVITAPTSEKMLGDEEFRKTSCCYQILYRASDAEEEKANDEERPLHYRDLDFAWQYWTKEFPKLAEKTRSIIVSILTSTASQFLTGSLRTVFTETESRRPAPPELARQGKILIVDMSVKVYEDVGVMANSLYKLLFQKAMERIPLKQSGIATALYADECQHFVNDYDFMFLQTSRSAGCSVFLLTQSINNLITKFGEQGEAKAYNLLGLIGNKFAHRNSCVKTNHYFAELIGQDWEMQASSSVHSGEESESFTSSMNEQRRYKVEPIRFTELLNGGVENNRIVEAILHNGSEWSTGEKYLRTYFQQQ